MRVTIIVEDGILLAGDRFVRNIDFAELGIDLTEVHAIQADTETGAMEFEYRPGEDGGKPENTLHTDVELVRGMSRKVDKKFKEAKQRRKADNPGRAAKDIDDVYDRATGIDLARENHGVDLPEPEPEPEPENNQPEV